VKAYPIEMLPLGYIAFFLIVLLFLIKLPSTSLLFSAMWRI
jgi:hypothetical protein